MKKLLIVALFVSLTGFSETSVKGDHKDVEAKSGSDRVEAKKTDAEKMLAAVQSACSSERPAAESAVKAVK